MREYVPSPVPPDPQRMPEYLSAELLRIADTLSLPRFLAPTLLNSWTNFGSGYAPAGFYKDGLGRVHLRGTLNTPTLTHPSTIFTLPSGFRPAEHLPFACLASGTPYVSVRVDVRSNGDVQLFGAPSTSWITLNGISFAAV